MASLIIDLDGPTQTDLERMSASAGIPASEYAARLLKRAIRAKRPRPVWDAEAIRANVEEFSEEDLALAESDSL